MVGEAGQEPETSEDIAGLRLADTETTATPQGEDWVEVEEEIEDEAGADDPLADEAGFQGTTDEIDAEIREVFLEEVQEEIEGLQHSLDDLEAQARRP